LHTRSLKTKRKVGREKEAGGDGCRMSITFGKSLGAEEKGKRLRKQKAEAFGGRREVHLTENAKLYAADKPGAARGVATSGKRVGKGKRLALNKKRETSPDGRERASRDTATSIGKKTSRKNAQKKTSQTVGLTYL